MEIDSTTQGKTGIFTRCWSKIKLFPTKLKDKTRHIVDNTKKIGKDDPRKCWHAAKVALALTLVSLLYYIGPLYHHFEQSVIWALLTVVVVFEFTAGATISKSINRGIATTFGGAFGIGAKRLAFLFGKEWEPIVLGVLVIGVAGVGTFTRFYPHIKRKYDYGVMIFVLTFSLVTVSGYRTENIFVLALQRIATILIGVVTTMTISLVIRPVWAGEDLNKLVSTNLEKLATFLEDFGSEYFNNSTAEARVECIKYDEDGLSEPFKSVFGSKATEESLANFAWWEPPHGSFRFKHPWKQYLKIGGLARECTCHLLALGCRLQYKSQAPTEFERRTEEACKRMITECSKALKELALSIKTMTQTMEKTHMCNAKTIIDDLKRTLGIAKAFFQNDESYVMDFIPATSVVAILIDVTNCVYKISEAVEELSIKACFKKENEVEEKKKNADSSSTEGAVEKQQPLSQLMHRGSVKPVLEDDVEGGDFVVIEIGDNIDKVNPVAGKKGEPVVCEITVVEDVKIAEKEGKSVVVGLCGGGGESIAMEKMTVGNKAP